MASTHLNSIVVWAVDPFAGSIKLQKEAGSAIEALLKCRKKVEVQPVYCAANPLPSLPQAFSREVFETLQEKARTEFARISSGLKLESLLPLVVLKSEKKSVAGRVATVLKYAKKNRAQMIVVSTRATKGLSRWFFGSFVETLSLESTLPLLTVNPSGANSFSNRTQSTLPFKTILFPTDFSDEAYSAFHSVMRLAKEMGSRIHIFHQFNPLLAFNWDFPISSAQTHVDWAKEEQASIETKARHWKEQAITQGISCTWEVETKSRDTVVESILKKSKKTPYLIAVTSRSGPIETSLLGSVTRQLIRGSTVPVMVIHPEVKKSRSNKKSMRLKSLKKNHFQVNYGNDEHANSTF